MVSENAKSPAERLTYHWKPGQSGNPSGTRAGIPWARAAQAWLEDCEAGNRVNRGMETLRAMWEKSLQGDTKAAALILERLWPAVQKQEVNVSQSVRDSNAMLDRLREVVKTSGDDSIC